MLHIHLQSTWAITCLKVISTVDYMIAAGNKHGEVTIFQIQKELPSDLISHEIAASLMPTKPIERYTIKNANRGEITCVEWSKNGMKLFSGDLNGVVLFTELDFNEHITKSIEILNEKYGIVQMNFSSPWLVVSTLYRAIICHQNESKQWKISQIGRTDRKVLNDFGAIFTPVDIVDRKPPSVICSRPGFRFWRADIEGNVSHTFLLKDSVTDIRSIFDVPLLNPTQCKATNIKDSFFGPCYYYMGKYIVTYCQSMVFIVNLEKLKVMAMIGRLRQIQYLTINGNEIFIVEGGRSIVRISTTPEPSTMINGVKYVPSINKNLMSNDAKIEIEEESIAQGDECFELPPVENIHLDIPLSCQINEHNLLKEDKLLLEHSRKMEVFEKINTLEYDDSILFETSTKKKKKIHVIGLESNECKIDGIVEIGQQAEFIDNRKFPSNQTTSLDRNVKPQQSQVEYTVKPFLLDTSFCDAPHSDQNNIVGITGQSKDNDPHKNHESKSKLYLMPKSPVQTSTFAFKPIEFNYPINLNPLNVDSSSNIIGKNEKSMIKSSNSVDEMTNQEKNKTKIDKNLMEISKCPSLANMPKLWDINLAECDVKQQSNGETEDVLSGNSTKEGSDNEWIFL